MFIATITARVCCLLATIVIDDSKDIDVFDMQFYLGYQLPYDTLNVAVIAGFF